MCPSVPKRAPPLWLYPLLSSLCDFFPRKKLAQFVPNQNRPPPPPESSVISPLPSPSLPPIPSNILAAQVPTNYVQHKNEDFGHKTAKKKGKKNDQKKVSYNHPRVHFHIFFLLLLFLCFFFASVPKKKQPTNEHKKKRRPLALYFCVLGGSDGSVMEWWWE